MNFFFIFIEQEKSFYMYVLFTLQNTYFVEYLIGTLVLSSSIFDAMVFDDLDTAVKFKQMLLITCDLNTSISTFIK
jgi:hypothetical protein